MEIALERNTIASFKTLGEQKTACSLSADAVVPDTQQDILRIVSADYCYRIRSKDIDLGKLVIRGDVDVAVSYVPDGGEGCCIIRLSIPYVADFGVPDADGSCESVCSMRIAACDVSLLNPRKIAVSAELEISAQCYKPCECSWYSSPVERPRLTFFREQSEQARFIKRVSEKSFVFEESYTPQRTAKPAMLISAVHSYGVESTEHVANKLVARIRGTTELIYSDEQNRLFAESFSSVFSQLFELPECGENAEFSITIVPSGEYCELSEDRFRVELHAVAQLVCSDTEAVIYIADAYSCCDDLALDFEDIPIQLTCGVENTTDNINLRYEAQQSVAEVISTRARVGRIAADAAGTSVQVCADLVFADSDGEIRSCRVRGTYETELICAAALVEEASAAAAGNGIDVHIVLRLGCCTQNVKDIRCVRAVSSEPCECGKKQPAVILRRADGDDMWDIAKMYRSDIAAINRINGIDDGESAAGRLLLIPRLK